jgi:predicted RNase H-like nuclease (RuvC/YqgF family)
MSQWDLAADEVKIEHDEPENDHHLGGILRKDSTAIAIDSSLLSPVEMSRIVSCSKEIANLEAQIEKLKKKETMEQNAHTAIQETQKKAYELNSVITALESERAPLEQQLAEMQAANDSLKAKVCK